MVKKIKPAALKLKIACLLNPANDFFLKGPSMYFQLSVANSSDKMLKPNMSIKEGSAANLILAKANKG